MGITATVGLEKSLHQSIDWLEKSERKQGGSAAYLNLFGIWSKSYPETTGYIIPILLNYSEIYPDHDKTDLAVRFGNWLLNIQHNEGYWYAGVHHKKNQSPSVFNTAQILIGMMALYEKTGDEKWLYSAKSAAEWLSRGVNVDGLWTSGHYSGFNPTYYTRVAWPMLIYSSVTDDAQAKNAAIRVLDHMLGRMNPNGTFNQWGFKKSAPAYSHTIAYTIRGFMESSLLLGDWDRYGAKLEGTINKLYRISELNKGLLPGTFDTDWNGDKRFTCLTGNAQIAICFLKWHEIKPDLRLVNAASKLIEKVREHQKSSIMFQHFDGAISGSVPIHGSYLRFRYPNWAAKFYADSVLILFQIIKKEKGETT